MTRDAGKARKKNADSCGKKRGGSGKRETTGDGRRFISIFLTKKGWEGFQGGGGEGGEWLGGGGRSGFFLFLSWFCLREIRAGRRRWPCGQSLIVAATIRVSRHGSSTRLPKSAVDRLKPGRRHGVQARSVYGRGGVNCNLPGAWSRTDDGASKLGQDVVDARTVPKRARGDSERWRADPAGGPGRGRRNIWRDAGGFLASDAARFSSTGAGCPVDGAWVVSEKGHRTWARKPVVSLTGASATPGPRSASTCGEYNIPFTAAGPGQGPDIEAMDPPPPPHHKVPGIRHRRGHGHVEGSRTDVEPRTELSNGLGRLNHRRARSPSTGR